MVRIPLVDPKDMTPEQHEQYDRFPSNLTRAVLLLAPRLARVLPEQANALRASPLGAKLREGIILRVAARCGSAYERMQHFEQAKKAGWTEGEIGAIESSTSFAQLGDFANVLRFVDACVASAHVSEDTIVSARRVLSDQDLATVVVLVGHYMTVARYVSVLGVELDPQPDGWSTEH